MIVSACLIGPSISASKHKLTTCIATMGGAKNLKLRGNGGGRGQGPGHKGTNFLVWTKCRLSFSCCVHPKHVAGSKCRAPRQWVRGLSPLEAETLSFWTLNKSCKSACLLIFDKGKNYRYWCCKMTFNKSHLGTCMVTRGHFITIKIFPKGTTGGARARARGPPA